MKASGIVRNKTLSITQFIVSTVVLLVPIFISDEVRKILLDPWSCLTKDCDPHPTGWIFFVSALFIACCIVLILIGGYEIFMARKYNDVIQINNKLLKDREEVNNLINRFKKIYPKSLCADLNFEKDGSHDRITFFLFDKENNNFTKFYRSSSNPNFNSGRIDIYEVDKGCICKAWESGFHYCNEFPDPNTDRAGYIKYTRDNYNLSEKEIEGLNMKSSLYCSWSIKDMDGIDNVAVVVIESTNKDKWTERQLKNFLNGRKEIMRQYIGIIDGITPKLSIAQLAGL